MNRILSREFSTWSGDIAQKSVNTSRSCAGFAVGVATVNLSFLSSARTTIIFPEIYSTGRQSRAVSPSLRLRKSHVILAEFSILFFSISKTLGIPVEPEV